MTRTRRPAATLVGRLAATVGLAAGATLAAAGAVSAAVPVAGGEAVLFPDKDGVAGCTLAATGWDGGGRAVAFTAAHCTSGIGEPMSLRRDTGLGAVGHVAARNEILDYAVVYLDGNVVPARQPGVSGIGAAPGPGAVVCKDGMSTGHTCGVVWEVKDDVIYHQACAGHGDSGAPVVAGDRLVGMVNGGDAPPLTGALAGSIDQILPPCVNPLQAPFFVPAYGTTFERVVADATSRGWPGGGFRMA